MQVSYRTNELATSCRPIIAVRQETAMTTTCHQHLTRTLRQPSRTYYSMLLFNWKPHT